MPPRLMAARWAQMRRHPPRAHVPNLSPSSTLPCHHAAIPRLMHRFDARGERRGKPWLGQWKYADGPRPAGQTGRLCCGRPSLRMTDANNSRIKKRMPCARDRKDDPHRDAEGAQVVSLRIMPNQSSTLYFFVTPGEDPGSRAASGNAPRDTPRPPPWMPGRARHDEVGRNTSHTAEPQIPLPFGERARDLGACTLVAAGEGLRRCDGSAHPIGQNPSPSAAKGPHP